MILQSAITCPHCGYVVVEQMLADSCQFFYDCKNCGIRLKPKHRRLLRLLFVRRCCVSPDTRNRQSLLLLTAPAADD